MAVVWPVEQVLQEYFDETGKKIVAKLVKGMSAKLRNAMDEQYATMKAECDKEFEEKATRLVSEQETLGNKQNDLKSQESALERRSAELGGREKELKAQLHAAAVKMQQAEAREANVDIYRNVLLQDQEEFKAQREAFKAEQETLAAANEKLKHREEVVAVLEHDLQFAKEQQLKAKEELLKVKTEEIERKEEAVVASLEIQQKENTAQMGDKNDLEGEQASGSRDLDEKGSSLNVSGTESVQGNEQVCDNNPQKEWISLHEFLQRLPGGVQEEAEKLSKIAEWVINRGKAAEVHVKVTQLQEITVGVKILPSSDISPLIAVTETGSYKKKSLRHLAINLVRVIRGRGARSGSQCSASPPPQP